MAHSGIVRPLRGGLTLDGLSKPSLSVGGVTLHQSHLAQIPECAGHLRLVWRFLSNRQHTLEQGAGAGWIATLQPQVPERLLGKDRAKVVSAVSSREQRRRLFVHGFSAAELALPDKKCPEVVQLIRQVARLDKRHLAINGHRLFVQLPRATDSPQPGFGCGEKV